MKIKIKRDSGEVYEEGSVMEASELINDYKDCLLDASDWKDIPEKSALDLISDLWGIEYEVVNE